MMKVKNIQKKKKKKKKINIEWLGFSESSLGKKKEKKRSSISLFSLPLLYALHPSLAH